MALVYSIWCGLGMVGAAVGGWWLFSQVLAPSAVVGIVLIVGGVAVLARAMGGAGG
ncbi:SMR family transporter [Vibrio parahaemolyticus]